MINLPASGIKPVPGRRRSQLCTAGDHWFYEAEKNITPQPCGSRFAFTRAPSNQERKMSREVPYAEDSRDLEPSNAYVSYDKKDDGPPVGGGVEELGAGAAVRQSGILGKVSGCMHTI